MNDHLPTFDESTRLALPHHADFGDRQPQDAADCASQLPMPAGDPASDTFPEPMPDGSDESLTDSQLKEANQRRAILIAAVVLLQQGATLDAAAASAGTNAAKLCRLLKLAGNSDDPRASAADKAWRLIEGPIADLAPGRSDGRPADWAVLLELETFTAKLRSIYLATIGTSHDYRVGADRRSASVATALERMAAEPECPPALALKLRRGAKPICLVRYLRKVTPELEAAIRGQRKLQLHGVVSRRDHTARLPDGTRADLPAGYLVELDDMSSNQPFWYDGPSGQGISRQGLYARDPISGRWLGVELVARPREAYRAEDILRFLRRLMTEFGKFSVLRMEQGIWRSKKIIGFTSAGAEEWIERPGGGDQEKALLQDGLEALGVRVKYEPSARGKGSLESSFDHLQMVLATFTTDFVNIGRHAGEFEAGAKALRRARSGSHTPEQLGFAHIDVLADRIEKAMAWCNARIKDRPESPDDRWSRDLAARPLPELTDRDRAVFLPEMRELTVRGLRLTATVDGTPHDFRCPLLAELGDGFRMSIRFDPTEPTLGAALYNRETSSANHFGWRVGEFVGWAAWEMPGPQLEVTPNEVAGLRIQNTREIYGVGPEADTGFSARRRQEKWVRTSVRVLPRPGQPAVKAASARDGRGNVAEVTAGARSRSEAPQRPTQRQAIDTRNSAAADPRLREFLEEDELQAP
jgi:hypothetical protein